MPSTALNALRYPALGDSPNVPLDLQRLAEDAERELNERDATIAALTTKTARYAWKGYWPTDLAISSGVTTNPAMTIDINVGPFATTGNNIAKVTIPVAGVYALSIQATYKSSSANPGSAAIHAMRDVGSTAILSARGALTGQWQGFAASGLARFTAGEVIRFDLLQSASVAVPIVGGSQYTFATLNLVSRD
jgi:hypothetical protein